MLPVINVFGIKISTYGICILLAAVTAAVLCTVKARKKNVYPETMIVIVVATLAGALLGAKLLYIFVSYPIDDLIRMMGKGDFSFFSASGYVFYGGLFGGIAGAFIGAKVAMTKLSYIEDCIVPFIPLAHAIGRVGCFLSGCCYGIPYEGVFAVPYGIIVQGHAPDETVFPVQLLEAFLDIVICLFLLYYSKKKRPKFDILFTYLALYGVMRFATEFLRGDAERGVFLGVSTSQWISLGLVAACVVRKVVHVISEKKNSAE